MNRRTIIYMLYLLGITVIIFTLIPVLSGQNNTEVEAQCVTFGIGSCTGYPRGQPNAVSCGCGSAGATCTPVGNTVQSGPWSGAYGVSTWNVVACICT